MTEAKPWLSDWLMKVATAKPPAERTQWARAMLAEYTELHRGQLQWALGCFSLSLGWWFRREWLFVAGILFSVCFLTELVSVAAFALTVWTHQERVLRWTLYILYYGPIFGACWVLTRYRPQYWIVIGIGLPTATNVEHLIQFSYIFSQPVTDFWKIHTMDARWDVGLGSLIGFGLMGALIGSKGGRYAVVART